ncbi:TRGV3 protein, partial [Geococcyx californianus]|nr:TRGV3 protein [Geococcyx californianus]
HLVCFLVFFLDGQVRLRQPEPSISKAQSKTVYIDCIVEGVRNFQTAYIHWYRHVHSKGPERILYLGSGKVSYEEESYGSKYFSSKKGTNVCTFSVKNINSNDEGIYYCAYW